MNNKPIGIFDSGVGGLSVVKAIHTLLPNESTVYLGDTARFPYGTRSSDIIIEFAKQDAYFLESKDVKCIIIACNSVSSVAYLQLRKELDTPVFGIINPATKLALASTRNNKIGVIGTSATIKSRAYQKAIKNLSPKTEVYSQPCPLLVQFVEEGYTSGEPLEIIIDSYLQPLKSKGIDTLILGCTHFPVLKTVISKILGDRVLLIDPAEEAVRELKRRLVEQNLISGIKNSINHSYFITDLTDGFIKTADLFLRNNIQKNIHQICIEKMSFSKKSNNKSKKTSRRVGIVLGGTPEEREYAVKSARDIAQSLKRLEHHSSQINFDKKIISNFQNKGIEVAFILDATFMGTEEEFASLGNRDLRQILEDMHISYTGSQRAAAEVTKNKIASKIAFLESNLSTPKYKILNLDNKLETETEHIASELKFPIIVKPRDEGSSIGISIAKDTRQLIEIVGKLRERFSHIFAEEYLVGKEVTVPILEVNESPRALAIIEIDHNSDFYSSDIKLRDFRMANQGRGSSLFHVPARLGKDIYKQVQKAAVEAHSAVGCRGYSRVDMIIDSDNTPQIMEINSLPVLESKDFVAWAARVEGIGYDELIEQILNTALSIPHDSK